MVGGDIVEQHGVGVAELDPPAAGQSGADACLSGVEHDRDCQLRRSRVQRVVRRVIRREALQRGVQFQAAGAGGDQVPEGGDGGVAVVRVD